MGRTQVTFNGHNLTDLFYVSDLQDALLPREIGSAKAGGRNGEIFTGVTLSARTIAMVLTVKGDTIDQVQEAGRELAAILAVDEPKRLELSIDGGIYYMALPSSPDVGKRFRHSRRHDVVFHALDPVAFGAEHTATVPSGGSVTVNVGGTYPTMPVVSATAARNGSGGYWRIRKEDGTYLLATVPSGVATAAVVADCEARTLKVNGVVSLLDPEASWLELEPGRHTLTMTGTGAATVTWRERWV